MMKRNIYLCTNRRFVGHKFAFTMALYVVAAAVRVSYISVDTRIYCFIILDYNFVVVVNAKKKKRGFILNS